MTTTQSPMQPTPRAGDKALFQPQFLLFLIPFFLLSILLFFRAGLAKVDGEPRLDVPVIGLDNTHLVVTSRLKNAFSTDMNKTIESGKNVSFHFLVELYCSRFSLIPDQEIWSEEEIHLVSYNAATREYSVGITRGSNSTTRYTSNPDEMMRWVNTVSVVVPDLFERSNESKEYYVRAWSYADTELFPGRFKTRKIYSKKFVPQRLFKENVTKDKSTGP